MFKGLFKSSGKHQFKVGTHRRKPGTGKHRSSGGRHRTKSAWDTNFFSFDYRPRHGR